MEIKLTPKQNAVIYCLQNGWILVTDSEVRGATVARNKISFTINNGVFWNLVDKGLIYQGGNEVRHHFVLTTLGMKIKTRKVEIK